MPEGSSPWEFSPIELTCKARKVNGWELLENEVTPDVPQSPVTTDSPEERITLVPYGCTRIRITHFPIAPESARERPPAVAKPGSTPYGGREVHGPAGFVPRE